MLTVYVEGVGLFGPGLKGWSASAPVLAGQAPYVPGATDIPAVALLPPVERRRTTATIKLALAAASEAISASGRNPACVATVFATSGGDGETIDGILQSLASPAREVSPTRFHNSVHNAPSGYWALATGCREPSTTLSAHDWTFAAGLLEAATLATVDDRAVALTAYDCAFPEPLHAARPIEGNFGLALALAPGRTDNTLARLRVATGTEEAVETEVAEPALEALRRGNPAARSLPLLQALAGVPGDRIVLRRTGGRSLLVTVDLIAS